MPEEKLEEMRDSIAFTYERSLNGDMMRSHSGAMIEGIKRAVSPKSPKVKSPKFKIEKPKPIRQYGRNKWKMASILLSLLTIASVGATILYTMYPVNLKFGVETAYGLELRQTDGVTKVTEVDFLLIAKGATKTLTYRLYNTGNKEEIVQWTISDLAGLWSFTIESWNSGANQTIAKGDFLAVNLKMTEVNAVGGVQYTATLAFNVVG